MKSLYNDPAYAEVLTSMKKELTRIRKQYKDDGSVVEFDVPRARRGNRKKANQRKAKKEQATE